MDSIPNRRYGVSAVQYDSDRQKILNVHAHEISPDDKMSRVGVYPRSAMLKAIEEQELLLVTLPAAFDGKYTVGPLVTVVEIQNEKFLKANDDESASDNLGELPEF